MLTGAHPFHRGQMLETATAILNEAPRPLSLLAPEVPELVQRTVDKMLAKNVSSRFQSVHEVLTDLRSSVGASGFAASATKRSKDLKPDCRPRDPRQKRSTTTPLELQDCTVLAPM